LLSPIAKEVSASRDMYVKNKSPYKRRKTKKKRKRKKEVGYLSELIGDRIKSFS
jgi:hypothetical protein